MKLKIPDGTSVEAELVEFKTLKEDWNTYQLSDGTIIKVKDVVAQIYRLDTIDAATEQHNYFVRHNTIISAMEPTKKE